MAGMVSKVVMKKIFKENNQNKYGQEDPYFETVPATKMSGLHNLAKVKKRKKALPPGLTPEEEKVLVKVKRRAYRLDMSLFNLFGLRFGWSSVIALLPVVGDGLDALLALMVVRTAMQVGLPNSIRAQMVMNIIIDFLVGLVPLIGDLADVAYKANTRNAMVLEKYLREEGKKRMRASGVPVGFDPSLPENFVEDDGSDRSGNVAVSRGGRGYDEEARIEGGGPSRPEQSYRQDSRRHPSQAKAPQKPTSSRKSSRR